MSKAKKKSTVEKVLDKVTGKGKEAIPAPTAVTETVEAPKKPEVINYSPRDPEAPQVVRDFGTDKHSQNAKDMTEIIGYVFNTQGEKQFNSDYIRKMVLKYTKVDISALYPKDYPCSSVHTALHALSKNETDEENDNKDGKKQDTFARGIRGFLWKAPRVGLKYPLGFYQKNPTVDYPSGVTESQVKAACQRIVDRDPRANR